MNHSAERGGRLRGPRWRCRCLSTGTEEIRKANSMDAEVSQDGAGTGAERKTVVRGQLRGS